MKFWANPSTGSGDPSIHPPGATALGERAEKLLFLQVQCP